MKTLTWDSGYTWDDPNLRWGDPSYILEPGDPGYTPPTPTTTPPKKGKRTMSNNPISRTLTVILALAEDAADGATAIQDAVGLKQTRDTDLRALIATLKGDPTTPSGSPAFLGLNFLYDQAKLATAAASAALKAKDTEVKDFLTDARDVLKKILGSEWSPAWVTAGYTKPGSTAVPGTQDERFDSISISANYFTVNPAHESPGPAPHPVITAARAQTLHTALSDARTLVNARGNAQEAAKLARDAAAETLRRRLIALVDELSLLLSDDDPRWEVFGLNIPASPRAPDPAANLVLSVAGPQQVLAEWERGTRSNDNRVLIWVVGVDTNWREYSKSGDATDELIKGQPPGATLKVKIIALNSGLEASDGPEAQISVP
jgi:hypothetical protein